MKSLLLAALIGCTRVAPASAPPSFSFHPVARGFARADALSAMRLCPTSTETFICGGSSLPVLRNRTFVRDAALEAGLPRDGDRLAGAVMTITGEWLTFRWDSYDHSVFRWTGSEWREGVRVDAFRADVVVRGSTPLLVMRTSGHPVEVRSLTGGEAPTPSNLDELGAHDLFLHDSLATARGDLFVRRHGFEDHDMDRFPPGAMAPLLVSDPPGAVVHGIVAAGDEVVGFGSRGDDLPDLGAFRGGAWSTLDTKGLRGAVTAYASLGDETFVIADGVFHRTAGSAFAAVPRPRGNDAEVFIHAPGDVWILRYEENAGLLERTLAPPALAVFPEHHDCRHDAAE